MMTKREEVEAMLLSDVIRNISFIHFSQGDLR